MIGPGDYVEQCVLSKVVKVNDLQIFLRVPTDLKRIPTDLKAHRKFSNSVG